jgi:hypothetical protein
MVFFFHLSITYIAAFAHCLQTFDKSVVVFSFMQYLGGWWCILTVHCTVTFYYMIVILFKQKSAVLQHVVFVHHKNKYLTI